MGRGTGVLMSLESDVLELELQTTVSCVTGCYGFNSGP